MALRIGINGFGRIGRICLRVLQQHPDLLCTGINDLLPAPTMAHLFKYDSTHGIFEGGVEGKENALIVDGETIPVSSEKDPASIPWKKWGVDLVLECTGLFTSFDAAKKHLAGGAKKVIISAPAKGDDVPTFVFGVNHLAYDAAHEHIVSNASCTTNCLAPVVKVLHEAFGVTRGFMTTIHSYTNDQNLVDGPHKDLRRARAAAVSQIPTTTGAAKAVGLVLPELKGKLDGMAIRVPTINVSCVDFVGELSKKITAEDANAALKKAAAGPLKGVLAFCPEELVSVDFIGNPHSSIVDGPSTRTIDQMIKVLAWYDNEIGFCHRMIDVAAHMGKQL